MSDHIHRRESCRLCESVNLELAVPMQPSPIADAYVPASGLGKSQALYPLDLYLCTNCGHVQNLDVVDPEILFRDYLFTTASSAGLIEHFERYAAEVIESMGIRKDSLVVEIGSNDGSLLGFFRREGMRVLGVDPAREIAARATANGIETLPEFFDSALVGRIRSDRGPASLVCANNVFAHADNLADIVCGIRDLLADDGVFVFEVSYLPDIVDSFLFDTVYHEHVSYHSVAPLAAFFRRLDMELFDVERIPSKGGSIRGFAQRKPSGKRAVTPAVAELTAMEHDRGFDAVSLYHDYSQQIAERKAAVVRAVDEALAAGKMVAGYGASTTTTTLMWQFDLTRKLSFVADDNPTKHGLYCPGCHVPVVPSDELYVRRPDIVLILAWQYATPIMRRHARFMEEGGVFAVPLPKFETHP